MFGYSQTYLVKTTGSECGCHDEKVSREAFFQCGNYCYSGEIKLDLQQAFGEITLKDIPALVPTVQRQQEDLTYLCGGNSNDVPASSFYHGPIKEMEKARDFVVSEIVSEGISSQMAQLKVRHPWIDDERHVYFELIGDASSLFPDIMFIASRVYAKGLIFTALYFEGAIYVTLEDCTGDQPLLDISFPDISGVGRGATLAIYDDDGPWWMKLSIWQAQAARRNGSEMKIQPSHEPIAKNLSSDCYVQSYCILKSKDDSDTREVLFRFGSWCYAGKVELCHKILVADIPYVIPALRVQQNKLDFLSDISCLPSSSPFARVMEYAEQKQPYLEHQAAESEAYLRNLITSVADDSSPKGRHWLEEDASESFFEFSCFNDGDSMAALGNVELFATKIYNPSGVVSMSMYYGGNWYLALEDGDDFPLLDSKFPDLSSKGHGYNIQCYPAGILGWPQLRKMSVWRIGCDDDDFSIKDEAISESVSTDCAPLSDTDGHGSISTANQSNDNDDTVTKHPNRLKAKLEEISSEDPGKPAWDIDGKPLEKEHEDCALSSDAGESDDGDIYAQLDKLDKRLDDELHGLREFGILERSRLNPVDEGRK